MDLSQATACQLLRQLNADEITCADIMKAVLANIDQCEEKIGAFTLVRDHDVLVAEAEEVDKRRNRGQAVGPLGGLPVAIKDNICTQDIRTTCASRMLAEFVPPYDATVVEHLRNADAIILGKTNMDEFAMGSSTENSWLKVTHNPQSFEHVPGGSSGGSAAAVAADETVIALGSDTGGSIRQPASFCGVVGLKPTYGRVSRYGLVAFASSLDQIGVLAKDTADAALMLGVIAGHDAKDATSADIEVPTYTPAANGQKIFRVGVPQEYFGEGVDSQVLKATEGAIKLLEEEGHTIISTSLPHTEYAVATYYIVACAEASSNLARYDGVHYGFRAGDAQDLIEMVTQTRTEGFSREVQRRIMLGTYVLSAGYYDAYYQKAAKVRTLITRDFELAFEQCDVLIHPVAPTPAFKIGSKVDDPLAMYLGDIFSATANLAGIPAISIPCGRSSDGLPIGVQLAARRFDEETLLSAAGRLEQLLRGSC